MLQFINGSDEAFADLERRAKTACIVFQNEELPTGCDPRQARVGFEIDPDTESTILLVEHGITYDGNNDQVRAWLSSGEKRFSNFSVLQQWIRTDLAAAYTSASSLSQLTDFGEVGELLRTPRSVHQVSKEALFEELSKDIRGQDDALKRLSRRVVHHIARRNPRRPATFFSIGPTGVGKTKTAESLALALKKLADTEHSFGYLRLDMSEYQEGHRVSQLLGAPQGYIGYGDGAQLIDALSLNPRTVVLFDEIEKAHPNILKSLMNAMDAGRLSSPAKASGAREVDCRSAIFVFTSNIEASKILSDLETHADASDSVLDDICRRQLRSTGVAPEIISRIGSFLVFRNLTPETRMEILALAVVRIAEEYGVKVKRIASETLAALLDQVRGGSFGSRPDEYLIDDFLGSAFAEAASRPNTEVEIAGVMPFRCVPFINSAEDKETN
jgi:AAA domain (Cdc48 subfamily)